MSNRINGQWRLKTRPVGMVKAIDFEFITEPVPDLKANEFLVRNLYFSFEPAIRGGLNDVESYVPPVQINEVMCAFTVGQVIESDTADFSPGLCPMLSWKMPLWN